MMAINIQQGSTFTGSLSCNEHSKFILLVGIYLYQVMISIDWYEVKGYELPKAYCLNIEDYSLNVSHHPKDLEAGIVGTHTQIVYCSFAT